MKRILKRVHPFLTIDNHNLDHLARKMWTLKIFYPYIFETMHRLYLPNFKNLHRISKGIILSILKSNKISFQKNIKNNKNNKTN